MRFFGSNNFDQISSKSEQKSMKINKFFEKIQKNAKHFDENLLNLITRVHNKNSEGECLTRTVSAKITAYVRGYP